MSDEKTTEEVDVATAGVDQPIEGQSPAPAEEPQASPDGGSSGDEKPKRGGRKPKPKADEVDQPTIGRIVRYVGKGRVQYPAIVVDAGEEALTLNVFTPRGVVPVFGIKYGAEGTTPRTWHWPESN